MNEVDWLRGTDLRAMVLHVADRASLRKARLFAAACCRRVWPAFQDRRGRDAVEGAERLADGLAGAADQAEASDGALAAVDEVARQDPEFFTRADHFANVAAYWACRSLPDHVMGAAWHTAAAAGRQALAAAPRRADLRAVRVEAEEREFAWQRQLLRDIVGNPFRPAPAIDPAWLSWNDNTVPRLAQAIYESRAFDRLPALGDALEDAGCTDPDILAHCRGPGPHIRGCWVVDLLLGKE